jgi:ABC-type transporter Mla subunit MlaD
MEDGKRYFRLGLFVVVAIVTGAAVLFALGARKLFEPSYTIESYFAGSVAGLQIGSQLNYRGVPLGEVSEIVTSGAVYEGAVPLAKRRNYIIVRAKVRLSAVKSVYVKRDFPEMVTLGLRAQTHLAGITGGQYLALDFLDPKTHPPLPFDWTPRYPYVPSVPSVADEILTKAQVFIAQLGEVDVKRLSEHLDGLLVNANDKLDQLPVAELSGEADKALQSANVTLARAQQLLAQPGIPQSIDNVAALTGKLRGLATDGRLDALIVHLDETADRLNGLIGDNQYDARVIVQDLRDTAENLRTLSGTLKRYPAGVLIGGPPEKVHLPTEHPR